MTHTLTQTDMLLLVMLVALVGISGFFSSSETGMMAVNRYRLRYLAKHHHRLAKQVLYLLKRPDRLLGVILIGNTFANILASSVATLLAVKFFGEVGVLAVTVLLTLIILIFAEMAPKTVAALYAERVAFFVVWPLRFLLYVFYPIVWLANLVANGLLKLFGVNVCALPQDTLSREELRSVVHEASTHTSHDYHRMLLGVFDLEKISIEHIMIPKNEIIGIDITDDWETILSQLTNSQHTRLPVYERDLENLKGILHVRLALNLIADHSFSKDTLLEQLEDILYIPENTPLNRQLLQFRHHKKRMGFVVDEYGVMLGLVTLEDILEEIVGEFTTDFATTMSQDIHPQSDGSYIIDAAMTIRDLNRDMKWQLPTDGPKTLSGLIIEKFQDIPRAHMSVRIKDYLIEVMQVKDNTIRSAKIKRVVSDN